MGEKYEYRVWCDVPDHVLRAPKWESLDACRRFLAGITEFPCRPRIQRRLVVVPPAPPEWEDTDES